MPLPKLQGCVLDKPSINSILLGTKHINVNAICRLQGLDPSYIGKIINGKKIPTIATARKIAGAIGMGLEEFLDALDTRLELIAQHKKDVVSGYVVRVVKERKVNYSRRAAGRPIKQPMPGLHIPPKK